MKDRLGQGPTSFSVKSSSLSFCACDTSLCIWGRTKKWKGGWSRAHRHIPCFLIKPSTSTWPCTLAAACLSSPLLPLLLSTTVVACVPIDCTSSAITALQRCSSGLGVSREREEVDKKYFKLIQCVTLISLLAY